jgi:hypothetical protein
MKYKILLSLLLFTTLINAQETADYKELFRDENYAAAIPLLQTELKNNPSDPSLNYKLGLCYLFTYKHREKSVELLQKVTEIEKENADAWLYLGRAYNLNSRFDEAVKAYNTYLELAGTKADEAVKRAIQMCNNAKDLMQFPQDVSFENLGKNVNTEYAEYFPFFTLNEGALYFSSNRKGTTGNQPDKNGSYPADIFMSEVKSGSFAKARNIGTSVNTAFSEEICGLSNDGKVLFVFVDNFESHGISDVYMSIAKGKQFPKPTILGKNVDTEKYNESSACLSYDGTTLFFASDRPGGKGGKDIYISQKLPNGDWGIAVNAGPNINSPFDEEFPNLSTDGKTFYFASRGHNSIGGYDVFKSLFNEETKDWDEAKNIGYPINTVDDNTTFAVTKSGREAYVSTYRPDGLGDLDIYKVTFNQVDPKFTVFKGFLQNADSTNINSEAALMITSKKTKELFGSYTIPSSKKGKYMFYLPPGVYEVSITSAGYKEEKQDVTVLDKSGYKDEIQKNFIIKKVGDELKTSSKKTTKQVVKKK